MTLYRGAHQLPHQCQLVKRDLHGEEIARALGADVYAYRLTAQQVQERREGRKPGLGLPYEFLLYVPNHPALNWTAFYDRAAMDVWCAAYGVTLVSEPEPGQMFHLTLPSSVDAFQVLHQGESALGWAPSKP